MSHSKPCFFTMPDGIVIETRNEITLRSDGVLEVHLTQGKTAFVDIEYISTVASCRWCTHHHRGTWYAITGKPGAALHRAIFGAPGLQIDHINRDGLDNRRSNLRVATHSQNQANSKLRVNNRSGHKGVFWSRTRNYWCAQFRGRHLGCFSTAEAASEAHDSAARSRYGEFYRVK